MLTNKMSLKLVNPTCLKSACLWGSPLKYLHLTLYQEHMGEECFLSIDIVKPVNKALK